MSGTDSGQVGVSEWLVTVTPAEPGFEPGSGVTDTSLVEIVRPPHVLKEAKSSETGTETSTTVVLCGDTREV